MRGGTYTLTRERDTVATTSDSEGVPVLGEPDELDLCGCTLAQIGAREVLRAQQFGEDVAAVAGVPHGSDVEYPDRIVVKGALNPCAPDQLLGTWIVAGIVARPTRLRVFLRRNLPADEPEV